MRRPAPLPTPPDAAESAPHAPGGAEPKPSPPTSLSCCVRTRPRLLIRGTRGMQYPGELTARDVWRAARALDGACAPRSGDSRSARVADG